MGSKGDLASMARTGMVQQQGMVAAFGDHHPVCVICKHCHPVEVPGGLAHGNCLTEHTGEAGLATSLHHHITWVFEDLQAPS